MLESRIGGRVEREQDWEKRGPKMPVAGQIKELLKVEEWAKRVKRRKLNSGCCCCCSGRIKDKKG